MIIAVVLELMDLLSLAYEQTERWAVLKYLITGPLWYTYVIGQILICSLGSFLLLTIIVLFKLPQKLSNFLVFLTSGLLLIQVHIDAMECCYRRTAGIKKLSWIYQFYAGIFGKRGDPGSSYNFYRAFSHVTPI